MRPLLPRELRPRTPCVPSLYFRCAHFLRVGLALLLAASIAQAADNTRIAVVQLVAQAGVEPSLAVTLTSLLTGELVSLRKFDVVDRANLDKVMREQAFQQSGCSEQACAVKIGNILNVQKLVVGTLSKLGSQTLISVSFVDVERSRIELNETESATSDDELLARIRSLARKLDAKVRVSGRILSAKDDGTFLVNLGSDDGLTTASRLSIMRYGEAVVDQATGDFLGREVTELGAAKLVKLDAGGSLATLRPLEGAQIFKVGDRVTLSESSPSTPAPPPPTASSKPGLAQDAYDKPSQSAAASSRAAADRSISPSASGSALKPVLIVTGVLATLGGAAGATLSYLSMSTSWSSYAGLSTGYSPSTYDDAYNAYKNAYINTGVFTGIAGLGVAVLIAGLIVKSPAHKIAVFPNYNGRDFHLFLAARF